MSSQPSVIPVVGVIGGIGSGKSSVTRRLREISLAAGRPVEVIDADQLGHQVLLSPNVTDRIRERFGDAVFEPISPSGPISPMISRSTLARIVFGTDPSAETARRDLERIVHPEIRSLAERQIRELRQRGDVAVILLDAALLLEAGWDSVCDLVAFIETPDAVRLARVQAGRGWSAEELAKREASQWPLPRKRAAADVVIDNSGSVDDAAEHLNQIIRQKLSAKDE